MTTYGYIRKGFPMSETDQLTELLTYGCDEFFLEDYFLKNDKELEVLLSRIAAGDQVVVAQLQVFGRTIQQLSTIMLAFERQQIRFVSLRDDVDTQADSSFYSVFELFSRVDGECRSERMKQQLAVSREDGRNIGRPALNEKTIQRVYDLYHEKKWPMRKIAEACDVSLGSVFKYTQKGEASTSESAMSY